MLAINPKIKQKAEDIRKKIFGSEVRESLASGIEAISEDVEATIGRQGYVEEQFQDVLDETTGKDVISAPELIAARNGKSNLKTRLDDEHEQVTAQLQQTDAKKVGDGVLATMSDLSQDVKEAMTGGSVAVVGEGAVGKINLANDIKKELETIEQKAHGVTVRELPNGIKDTVQKNSDGSYTFTQRIMEKRLEDGDLFQLVTTGTNVDYLRLNKPSDYIRYNIGGNIDGTLVLEGVLGDRAYADHATTVGYVSSVATIYYGPVFEKGRYPNLESAKADFIGRKLLYELAQPIVRHITPETASNTHRVLSLEDRIKDFGLYSPSNLWNGKTGNFLGDSITVGSYGNYLTIVKDMLGLAKVNNYGVGGGRLAVTGDPIIDDAYTPLIRRYQNIDMSADFIFVLIGTNDYSSQVPIGTNDSLSEMEFKGSLNIMMEWFRVNFPDKPVIFASPLHRYNDNQYPIKMNEYREAIRERCEAKQFLFFDAYRMTGFDFAKAYYDKVLSSDGLHPNAKGAEILGRRISGFLNQL